MQLGCYELSYNTTATTMWGYSSLVAIHAGAVVLVLNLLQALLLLGLINVQRQVPRRPHVLRINACNLRKVRLAGLVLPQVVEQHNAELPVGFAEVLVVGQHLLQLLPRRTILLETVFQQKRVMEAGECAGRLVVEKLLEELVGLDVVCLDVLRVDRLVNFLFKYDIIYTMNEAIIYTNSSNKHHARSGSIAYQGIEVGRLHSHVVASHGFKLVGAVLA